MNLLSHVRALLAPALADVVPDRAGVPDYLAMVKPAANAENGDYQANFAMALGKLLGKKPQEVAKEVVARLAPNDAFDAPQVAGPGFINLRLKTSFLADALRLVAVDPRLGVPPAAAPRTFVVDYSGPNVAKPLHVGHLRSTIIGDALVRILRFAGHTVVGDNHLGDWGAQFGMLLYGYKRHRDEAAFAADPVRELARLYVFVRGLFKKGDDEDEGPTDDPVKAACQLETAKLHAGDPENLALWRQFMPACLAMLQPIYDRLSVKIDEALGESFYNPMLAGAVADMLARGIAFESQGAVVVPNAKGNVPRPGEEQAKEDPPAIVRKRDGAFTYTTTDLATIRHRMGTWRPDGLLYVVDARQALHFKTVFAQARRWGYADVEFQHVSFGSILGPDRKPFQTRKGDVVELSALLDEAAACGLQEYEASYADRKAHGHEVPELTAEVKRDIAEAVGIGAVKYADLSQNRTSDYVYDPKKMVATDGNTATYMQYAFARCRGILRRAEADEARFRVEPPPLLLEGPIERALALQLLRFPEAVEAAATDYLPHLITTYLWDLAKPFSSFFDKCHVLKAQTPELRESRLLLVDLVARAIERALGLLGIRTVERM